jgi:hypothetical protein
MLCPPYNKGRTPPPVLALLRRRELALQLDQPPSSHCAKLGDVESNVGGNPRAHDIYDGLARQGEAARLPEVDRGARRRSPVEFFGNKIDMEARFQQRQPPTREEYQGRAREVAGCRGSCVVSVEATLVMVRCGRGWVAKFYYGDLVARYI